jgi:hypothetical protein
MPQSNLDRTGETVYLSKRILDYMDNINNDSAVGDVFETFRHVVTTKQTHKDYISFLTLHKSLVARYKIPCHLPSSLKVLNDRMRKLIRPILGFQFLLHEMPTGVLDIKIPYRSIRSAISIWISSPLLWEMISKANAINTIPYINSVSDLDAERLRRIREFNEDNIVGSMNEG